MTEKSIKGLNLCPHSLLHIQTHTHTHTHILISHIGKIAEIWCFGYVNV